MHAGAATMFADAATRFAGAATMFVDTEMLYRRAELLHMMSERQDGPAHLQKLTLERTCRTGNGPDARWDEVPTSLSLAPSHQLNDPAAIGYARGHA